MSAICDTARWSAAARAAEAASADPLFRDDLAELLAGPAGIAEFTADGGAALLPYLSIRTRYLDDAIVDAVAAGCRQVVLLAAGMDTRAFRLELAASVDVYEIDHGELLADKEPALAGVAPRHARHLVAADLRTDWPPALLAAGFDPHRPAVWVVEGLLHYLTEADVHHLLTTVRGLSADRSRLAADLLGAATRPLTTAADEADETAWRFGTDLPELVLGACGWSADVVAQPGDDGAHFGRWPYPVPPRAARGVPRNFLVRATAA